MWASSPDDLDRLSPAELKGLVVQQWEQIVERSIRAKDSRNNKCFS